MVSTIMKQLQLWKPISTIIVLALLLMAPGAVAHASGDDPGAGRLSGNNIPAEFYDDSNSISQYGLSRYGTFDTQSPFTGSIYSHRDDFAMRMLLHGIDVSQWQKNIDWYQVKASGIDYAFIRVGYRGYGAAGTLNESTKDSYYDINMQNAIAAGVRVGVYIFSQATTTAEAEAEADYILSHLNGYNVTMPLIMDYEYASDASDGGRLKTAKLSKQAATDNCIAFCNRIAEAGYTPMIYASKSFLEDQLNMADITNLGYRVWLAHYTESSSYAGIYDFWQYSSKGKVPGIDGNVDMNFYYAQETDNFIPNGILIRDAMVTEIPVQAYTGAPIEPSFTVTYQGVPLINGVDYTVVYRNNIQAGEATIIIFGHGQYTGVKSIKFTIVNSSLKVKKHTTKAITLKWDKVKGCSGYQIYRSTAADGYYKKVATIKKKSIVTYKDANLKAGKAYYYKIRSYTKINGQKQFDEFSPVLTAYTKTGYSRYAIANAGACIYDSANVTDTVLAVLPEGASANVVYATKDGYDNSWYYVTYQDANGYYNGYIPAGQVTINMIGKVQKVKKVNVRKSASVASKKLTTLKKKTKVTVLDMKTKKGVTWYKVTFTKNDKTYNGWISAPYIKLQ